MWGRSQEGKGSGEALFLGSFRDQCGWAYHSLWGETQEEEQDVLAQAPLETEP